METNIHNIINNRAYLQETDNLINKDFYNVQKPKMEKERVNYNLVTLYIKGIEKYNKEINSNTYYCHECSYAFGYPVYHKNNYEFTEYINTPIIKRYYKELNELSDIF